MTPVKFSLNHLGIFVWDLKVMSDFYTSFFGFVITDRRDTGNPIQFLTGSPSEHHQVLLVSGRKPDTPSSLHQISFSLEDLAALRRVFEAAEAHPRTGPVTSLDHGNSWSIYFNDPEGNPIECYVHTPWHVDQPNGKPIDFSLTDQAIWDRTEAESKANPSYMPAEIFSARLAERLSKAWA
jgi:catechol 2,3-dioxygenase